MTISLESQLESQLESLSGRVLRILGNGPQGKAALAAQLGQKQASGQLHVTVRHLMGDGLIEPTVPSKPQSRLQRYRLTAKGCATLEGLKVQGPRPWLNNAESATHSSEHPRPVIGIGKFDAGHGFINLSLRLIGVTVAT